jgi:hypothetical protein
MGAVQPQRELSNQFAVGVGQLLYWHKTGSQHMDDGELLTPTGSLVQDWSWAFNWIIRGAASPPVLYILNRPNFGFHRVGPGRFD